MAFQFNQFKLTNNVGELMNSNSCAISVRLASGFVGILKAGDVVKFNSDTGDLPVVTQALSGDSGNGVIIFNAKKATYAANDVFEIALSGSIISMAAATGISARATLCAYNSVSGYVQSTSGNYLGYNLDIASVTGDIIRIFVQPKLS